VNENNKNQNTNGVRPPETDAAHKSAPSQTPAKPGGSYTVRRVVRPGQRPAPHAQGSQPRPAQPQSQPQAQANTPAAPRPQAPQRTPTPQTQSNQASVNDGTSLHKIPVSAPAPTSSTRVVVKSKKRKNPNSGSGFSSIIKALVYIVCVVGASLVISYFGIIISNDVFAFVKEDDETVITIPEYMTTGELADILYEEGIIKYPFVFKIYCGRNDNGKIEFVPGEYTVNANTSYDKLFTMFQKSTKRETVRIAFPEGLTVDEIVDLLVQNGVGTREGFIEVINEYDFLAAGYEYDFLEKLVIKPDRHYRLEGYLYPDTYEFYVNSDPKTAIDKMLKNFDTKFNGEYRERAEELGLSIHKVITLASIIEREATGDDAKLVSSVFHNRLASSKYPYLESCATVQYVLPERKERITVEDTKIDSPFNTYMHKGLPPGPIASPGLKAIEAALYPADTEYLFFAVSEDGEHAFSKTYEEHKENANINPN